MTRSTYDDELIRALERPDVGELQTAVSAYHTYSELKGKEREAYFNECPAPLELFFSTADDPDLGMALVALSASMYDDPHFLFLVAAGPLEDILGKPSREVIDRVVAEARKNARFRWMLTGIYLHAVSDEARPKIAAAIGTVTESDPVPPRLV
jgi:hypothetical protein